MKKKIVVIGAGSASFGLSTLSGLLREPALTGCRLTLVDINEKGLESVYRLACRMNSEWGADAVIERTTDRRAALPEADFVILAIAVDREKCWKIDHEIALKHGIMHYAENGGPGALFHTARNLAQVKPILRDMEALCPEALLLNFTNPVPRLSLAARRYTVIRTVGICHQIEFGYMMAGYILSDELGISVPDDFQYVWTDESSKIGKEILAAARAHLDITAAGINHFTWMMEVRRKNGEDLYPLFKKRFMERKDHFEPLTRKMIELFDFVPVSGDCHMCEYLPYSHNVNRDTWNKYQVQMYDLDRGTEGRNAMWKDIDELALGKGRLDDLKTAHTERAELIIAGIIENSHVWEDAVNLPNDGYIANLPQDALVEVPGIIDASGIKGVGIGSLPEPVAELCRRQISVAELAVKAGWEGDSKAAVQALALDPMIDDPELAQTLFKEYLNVHRNYLPQFC